jgi:hypothetical protein
MKKRIFTALVSILMIFVIAGCTNSENSNQTAPNGKKGNFQKPDVYGEVSSINGNKVNLKLLKIPQMNKPNGQVRGSDTGNMGVKSAAPNYENPGQGGGRMKAKTYTGEEKTITVPDNVQIITMTRGANGMGQSTITPDQIQTGSTLSVYYDTDGKTIKSIRVQQPMTDNGQSGNPAS